MFPGWLGRAEHGILCLDADPSAKWTKEMDIGVLIPGLVLVLGSTDQKLKVVGSAKRKIWGWEYSHLQKKALTFLSV